MSDSYQKEQLETFSKVRRVLSEMAPSEKEVLQSTCRDYLQFRSTVQTFLGDHFAAVCTRKCYQSRLSACCSKDGIITFFADVVINLLFSSEPQIQALEAQLTHPAKPDKCIYLTDDGCVWRIKPIVCEMFLCDVATESVFAQKPESAQIWADLKKRRKRFTWPDRPVLFDDLEKYFIDRGLQSPLMYLHNSPGLLRLKKRARDSKSRPTNRSPAAIGGSAT